MASVKISDDLRLLLRVVRESPERWGCPHGLSQDEAAERCGISASLYRKVELGDFPSTKISTLANICQALGIDPSLLDHYGYESVADELRMRVQTGKTMFLDLARLELLSLKDQENLARLLDKLAIQVERKNHQEVA